MAPAADGSADWTATLTSADGETILVHASSLPVDPAVVDTFVQGKAALGLTYVRADIIRYAAYRNVEAAFASAIQAAKTENKLGEKYDKYKKRLARIETAAPVAPTATPAPTPRAPESQWSRELEASLNDEELPQDIAPLPVEASNTAPEAYKHLTAEEINSKYNGKGTWSWQELGQTSSYIGDWSAGIPDGEAYMVVEGGEKIGPLQFEEGRSSYKKPGRPELLFTWLKDRKIVEVIE